MTPNETDRRRRRLLVRSLVGGRPDCSSGIDSGLAGSDVANPAATSAVAPDLRGEIAVPELGARPEFVPPRTRPAFPPEPQPTVTGPIRVVESQLDAVLRMLGAAPAAAAPLPVSQSPVITAPPASVPPPARERPAPPPTGASLMLPPFQPLPARRPTPTSRSRGPDLRTASPPPAVEPAAPFQAVPPVPTATPERSAAVVPAAPLEQSALLVPPRVSVATEQAVEMPTEIAAPAVVDTAMAHNLAERSAALRSRSKIGVMKQDAAALSARLKELARLLESDPDAPSDEALCAWDDCRRLALMLHHELDRGLPQPEGQRSSRTALPR